MQLNNRTVTTKSVADVINIPVTILSNFFNLKLTLKTDSVSVNDKFVAFWIKS